MLLLLACASTPPLDSSPSLEEGPDRPWDGRWQAREFEGNVDCGILQGFVPMESSYEVEDNGVFFTLSGFDWTSACVGLDPFSCEDVSVLDISDGEELRVTADLRLSGRVASSTRIRLDRDLVGDCEGAECEAFLGTADHLPCEQRNSFELVWEG